MESSSCERWSDASREKWRDGLRDRDFWLNGYREKVVNSFEASFSGVYWIIGAGPMASFARAIPNTILETHSSIYGPYKHVVKADLNPTSTAEEAQGRGITSIKYQLALAAAKELGLLDQKYNSLKEHHDQLQYYTYGCVDAGDSLEKHMRSTIVPLVWTQLSANQYMLVVDNLQWPIELRSLTLHCGLPLLPWTRSRWLILPTSQDAYNKSKSEEDGVISINTDGRVVYFTIVSLGLLAEHILNTIRQESMEYWHAVVLDCFHYVIAIFAKHPQVAAITSDELIHQLAVLQPCLTSTTTTSSSSKCSYMRRVGRVILESFQKYSLFQLPFSPANEAHEAINTAAQFFAFHGLIAEGITIDEICDNKKKWISFVGDRGWHVSREWLLSQDKEIRGTTALILRSCSQHILSKLNHSLPKLCFLRVLDLSYTPLKSLPSSIGCLQNLRLLSLRGCPDLKTLLISSTTSDTDSTKNTGSPLSTLYQLEMLDTSGTPLSHLTQDVAKQKTTLIYLDMSCSQLTTFPPNFFQDMSNLEELILGNCSNLVELPPSVIALSSLTTLEVTGTQIRHFPPKMFDEMQKLQSLKLIDNNNLISISSSRVHEIKLEGHPTLISFSLVAAPHIQRLSLRGCRKLESVDLRNLGALEELDLSGTSIKEIPADIPNGTKLRRLLLLGVPSLLRFPWHMLERLPEVFYLDQCTEVNGNHSNEVPQLVVSDPRFFYSFRKSCVDLVRAGRFFQSFDVRVASSCTNNMRPHHEEERVDNKLQELVQNQSTYMDVHSSCYASPVTVPFCRTERHVEITGMQQPPNGLYNLLSVTKSLSVTCDISFHAPYRTNFRDLEEYELRWCPKMERVFGQVVHLENLRNVRVCNLRSLVWFCSKDSSFAFSSLEHLHFEYCPRLEVMMPDAVTLPSLKTLDILFCYNLKKIFIGIDPHDSKYQLPSLQRIHLQELPLLQNFHDDEATVTAPMWKELHVRGCWSLGRLPRLQDQPQKVKVDGERRWWNKLQWGSLPHRKGYEPKLPPKFSSFDERAGVTSYLR